MQAILAEAIVGRAVKYADEITVIDPYIGKIARNAEGRTSINLRKFAQAIIFVAEQWSDVSPYATKEGLDVKIITRAGWVSASAYIEPDKARPGIERALSECDSNDIINRVTVIFKQDSKQSSFRARYIKAGAHCWKIDHEIRDLILLRREPGQRGDIAITQDCQTFRAFVADIEGLQEF